MIFVVISDYGMNNVPGVLSQTFSLPDLLVSLVRLGPPMPDRVVSLQ